LPDAAGTFDPFELQDTTAGRLRDPFGRLAELLAESPVHRGPVDLGAGRYPPLPDRPAPITVFGFEECREVLRDAERYSSSVYGSVVGLLMGRTILEMDGDEHRASRALVAPAFRSGVLERWEEGLVRAEVEALVDRFAGAGRADLVRQLTFDFPVKVIARILGLPRADYPRFQRWTLEITSAPANWPRALAASAALRDYFAPVLAERRRQPADDLISELATAEIDGERLGDEEIFSFLRLLLPAGVETTYRATGNMLAGLLGQPEQLAAVTARPELVPDAFEESLRWEPPVCVVLRRATAEGRLAGVRVEEGADVGLLLGAANHDARRFEHPERFDLFRPDRQHVGFGFGAHVCVGMHLARLEARVALECLLERCAELRLDGEAPIIGLNFRSPESLPVRFRPA